MTFPSFLNTLRFKAFSGLKPAFLALSAMLTSMLPHVAHAIEEKIPGQAVPWQLDFQLAATPVMEKLINLHNFLMVIAVSITVFVLGLLIWVVIRYNSKANPVPSKTSHNTLIEIIWTVVPVMILLVIAIPTLRNLYYMDRTAEADMTLKVVGNQWYWHYEYPDHGGFGFDSVMKEEKDLQPGDLRLLEVDRRIVIPVDTTVRVLGTGADVIHNFAVPAFGLKMDVIPGIINETWFRAQHTGVFYGQCSELCGVRHGYMPIAVEVVEKDMFDNWVKEQQLAANIDPAALAAEKAGEQTPGDTAQPAQGQEGTPPPSTEATDAKAQAPVAAEDDAIEAKKKAEGRPSGAAVE